MASNFDISQLSGTGTTVITVKPKAINEDTENIKEQILKITVQNVEREVTLIQKEKQIIETWRKVFVLDPNTTTYTFPGNKTGSKVEVSVSSYEQKYINDEPQEEYRTLGWVVNGEADWLKITKEESTEWNVPGKITIQCTKENGEYTGTECDPISRSVILSLQQTGSEESLSLEIVQEPGKVTYAIDFVGNGQTIEGVLSKEGSKEIVLAPEIHKEINLKTVKKYFTLEFKIPTFLERKQVSFSGIPPFGGTTINYSAECWNTSTVHTSWDTWERSRVFMGHFKIADNSDRPDQYTQQRIGAYPQWPVEWNFGLLPEGINASTIRNINDSSIQNFYFFA